MDHLRAKHNIQLPVSMESSPNGLSTNDNVISSAVNKNQPIYTPVNSETLSEKNPSHSSCQIEKPFVYDELQLSNILSEECRRALTGGIPNPPFAPTPVHEGPVTKHLRLTAALALRNLLQYSDVARRYVVLTNCFLSFIVVKGICRITTYSCIKCSLIIYISNHCSIPFM